ncbi:MAG TPA: Yip1 family protein [Blastocatellia bacterium]|nr:Yip1 family protein [Blastocatellia bacterium]
MSETENQIDTGAPAYAVPQTAPQTPPEEPARMNAMQRLIGALFSPGETFQDINRKPTIIVPIILGMILAVAAGLFFNWKVKPDWDRIFRSQIQRQLDRTGQSIPPEQIEQRVEFSKKLVPIFPLIGAVGTPIAYLFIAGVFALGMMLIQAKTTFKKILSVVSWSYLATALVQTIVTIVVVMVQDQETLNNVDPTQGLNIVPSNAAAFLPAGSSPALMAFAGSLDIFSIWYLILLSIGLAAVAGSRKITAKKTGGMVFGLWLVFVLVKVGWRGLFG